jgi:hypothetical protein
MFEDGARIHDVEAVVRVGKRAISFDNRGMVQERIIEYRIVQVASFDMRTSTSQVEQPASILDGVIEYVLSSARTEVQDAVGRPQDRVDMCIERDARIGVAETPDIALREETLSQREAVNELARN